MTSTETPSSGTSAHSDFWNLVVLISGSGTNLQAIIDALPTLAADTTARPARVSLVLSNRKAAYGLVRAASATPPIPTTVFSLAAYNKAHPGASRADYDLALADEVKKGKPDLIVLAGFMHILSSGFLERLTRDWDDKGPTKHARVPIINLHPALPGQFDGAHAIKRAWEAGPAGSKQITQTGIMVHEVIPEVDRGAPVLQEVVPLKADETLEQLEDRMHAVEHQLIVRGVQEMLRRAAASAA